MKFGLVVLLLFASNLLSSQPIPQLENNVSINLPLTFMGIDNEQSQSMSFTPLFKVKDSKVQNFLDLSGADFGSVEPEIPIVLPATAFKDLAYGYFFNSHLQNNIEPNYTLFVLEYPSNFQTVSKSRIWFDLNNNFNFTDDSVSYLKKGKLTNPLKLNRNSNLPLFVNFEYFPYRKFPQFSNMNDSAMKWLKGNRDYLGSKAALKESRLNLIYGKFIVDRDTLKIGLKDANLNGSYNDPNIDRIYIGQISDSIFQAKNAYIINEKNNVVFWMGNALELDFENINQGNLTVKLKAKYKNEYSLTVGEKIPRFKFCVAKKDAKRMSVRRVKGDYKIIYVWSADNVNFIKDTANLHAIQRTLPENIKLIMLNHGGSGKYVGRYNKRFEINAIQGFCSSKITKKLKLQNMPQVFILDESNRIVKIGKSSAVITQFLSKNGQSFE
jgi:hypothetical protein